MFQVVWLQSALNELAALWLQADSDFRGRITLATNALDEQLSADP